MLPLAPNCGTSIIGDVGVRDATWGADPTVLGVDAATLASSAARAWSMDVCRAGADDWDGSLVPRVESLGAGGASFACLSVARCTATSASISRWR